MPTTQLHIWSRRNKQLYKVNRFTEYSVDIDMDVDADEFNMVFGNPNGIYTGIFNKFDPVDIMIDDVPVFRGTIDDTEYIINDRQNVIQIVGRDLMSVLVDNDALPTTRFNVLPHKYIASKCEEYGITKYVLDKTAKVVPKLIIGTAESEISVMRNLIIQDNDFRRMWTIYDTLYMGEWDTGAKPKYYFTRGVPSDQSGIPIKSIRLRDSGAELASEMVIYGSMDDGTEKVIGRSKNDYLISQGIKKRKTLRSSNNDSSSKYASNALRKIREAFRTGIELIITIKTNDVILPNTTAHVVDADAKINSTFFIKGVKYSKSISEGSITTITMIPGDVTFDVLWDNQGDKTKGSITGTSNMSLSELLKTRK